MPHRNIKSNNNLKLGHWPRNNPQSTQRCETKPPIYVAVSNSGWSSSYHVYKDHLWHPSIMKVLEEGFWRVHININELNHHSPHRLSVHDEFILNEVFQFGFVPLFPSKCLFIAFRPYCSKGNAAKQVPNYNVLRELLGESFPKRVWFLLKLSWLPMWRHKCHT